MRKKTWAYWLQMTRATAFLLVWISILSLLAWAIWFYGVTRAKHGPGPRFSSASTPRFEISTAKLVDGKEIVILADKRTGRDYLALVAGGSVSLVPLPWKDNDNRD
jgi:hypothetical protein